MQSIVRNKLTELVNSHGNNICKDTQNLANLLNEYCPQQQAAVKLIITTLEETSVVGKLLNSSTNIHKEVTLGQLKSQLQQELYITPEAAIWSLESWASALGIITPNEWYPSNDKVNHNFSDRTSEVLKTLIKNHGQLICTDSKKLRAYINDYSSNTSENKLLTRVSQQGIVKQLISASDNLSTSLLKELVQQLENELFLTSQAANWSIDTWTKALDLTPEISRPSYQAKQDQNPYAKSSYYRSESTPTQQAEKSGNNASKLNKLVIAIVSILGLFLFGGGFYTLISNRQKAELAAYKSSSTENPSSSKSDRDNTEDLEMRKRLIQEEEPELTPPGNKVNSSFEKNTAKSSCGDKSINTSKTFYRVYAANQGDNLSKIRQLHCQDAFAKSDRIQVAAFQNAAKAAELTKQINLDVGSAWQERIEAK